MTLPPPFRAPARVLSFLFSLALASPIAIAGQPLASGSPALAPEVRERLTQTAGDGSLQPWQRRYLRHLAGGDGTSVVESLPPEIRTEPSALVATATGGSWEETIPGGRVVHCAIYDPVRDRIIVFGGEDEHYNLLSDLWQLSLTGDCTWTRLTPAGAPPSARAAASAIYDPVRGRMIMCGGVAAGNTPLIDVWALSLGDVPVWTRLTPIAGVLPSGRYGHRAIYDPVRDRMVVFGGGTDSYHTPPLNDAWALSLRDTLAWTRLTPTSGTAPVGRYWPSAIYDPVRDRMIVFGGGYTPLNGAYRQNDVWALSLAGTPAWTELHPAGPLPTARLGHSAIYDPVRDRMVVCGAATDGLWVLSLGNAPGWTALTPAPGEAGQRGYHVAVYDSGRDRMIVCGGSEYGAIRHDTWALTLAGTPSWVELQPNGRRPLGRVYHRAIHDPVRHRMIVFGGWDFDGHSAFNDVWALSLTGTPTWTEIRPTGTLPAGREFSSAIYDPLRDRMVVFGGGGNESTFYNDVWTLSLGNGPAWIELKPTGAAPIGRVGHSAIYDPPRDRMVVFGGETTGARSTTTSGRCRWGTRRPGRSCTPPVHCRLPEWGTQRSTTPCVIA